jgi:ABC-type antimicrobial peptide transport system permease subunit
MAGLASGVRATAAAVLLAGAIVMAVALCASALPARKASGIEAADALRGD